MSISAVSSSLNTATPNTDTNQLQAEIAKLSKQITKEQKSNDDAKVKEVVIAQLQAQIQQLEAQIQQAQSASANKAANSNKPAPINLISDSQIDAMA